MDTRNKLYEILEMLPQNIREILKEIDNSDSNNIQEIRFRINSPIFAVYLGQGRFINKKFILEREDINRIFQRLCNFSLFSFEEEIREGYITVRGGHRVGICGRAVTEKGIIKNIKDINSINIRFSKEINDCSDKIFDYIKKKGLSNILIASEPCGGKTTVLRDLVRKISKGGLGEFISLSIIDEKGELCACINGFPQNDIGQCCDIFDMYPKKEGIVRALKFFSPKLIVLDEITTVEESREIIKGMNGGVPFIATVHGKNFEELKRRPQIKILLDNGCIDGIFFLKGREMPGQINNFFDRSEIYA